MATLKELEKELEPYKDTLVLNYFKVMRLVRVIDGDYDFYWIFENEKGEEEGLSCVGGWIPLKGHLPDDEYEDLVRVWNLNHSSKVV